MEKKEIAAPAHDLATRIYVELVARHTQVAEGSVKMTASAANLAALSLRLADAFMQAEQEAIAGKAPVTNYKLEDSHIAEWLK